MRGWQRLALGVSLLAVVGCGPEGVAAATSEVPGAAVAETPSSTPTAQTRTVSISASGDLLAHNTLYSKAKSAKGYDFRPMLAPLAALLSADIDICHLETPLVKGTPSSYPVFGTPVSLADAIAATGWEGCSVASNHSLDKGVAGVVTTYRELRKRGLQSAGTSPSKSEPPAAWYTTADGVRVAQLAYSYGFNGFRPPADQPKLVNKIRVGSILSAARWVREHGADLVVVSLHWGTEYSDTPNSWQRDIAKQLTASPDVDAIIGHHSHVLQSADIVNGKPVIYGLGNLWSGQGPWANQPDGQHGAIVKLEFEVTEQGARFTGGSYEPTLTLYRSWKVKSATRVTESGQTYEACRAIKDAVEHLGSVLDGPRACPKR